MGTPGSPKMTEVWEEHLETRFSPSGTKKALRGPRSMRLPSPMAQRIKKICLQCRRRRRRGYDPWIRKISWRREMPSHSSMLAWEIPWTEELDRLQSKGSQRVRNHRGMERTQHRCLKRRKKCSRKEKQRQETEKQGES